MLAKVCELKARILNRAKELWMKDTDFYDSIESIEAVFGEIEANSNEADMLEAVITIEKVLSLVDMTRYKYPKNRKELVDMVLSLSKGGVA